MSSFHWAEFAMHTINSRQIGLSTSSEALCPIDIIPVWSQLEPKTLVGASRCLLDMMTTFTKKWEEIYLLTITQQNKWFASNHELGEQDVMFIKNLRTELGTPRLARIINVDTDSQGTEKYYDCQYKQRKSGNFNTVRQPAQSLCLLLTAEEINNKEDVTRNSLEFLA